MECMCKMPICIPVCMALLTAAFKKVCYILTSLAYHLGSPLVHQIPLGSQHYHHRTATHSHTLDHLVETLNMETCCLQSTLWKVVDNHSKYCERTTCNALTQLQMTLASRLCSHTLPRLLLHSEILFSSPLHKK